MSDSCDVAKLPENSNSLPAQVLLLVWGTLYESRHCAVDSIRSSKNFSDGYRPTLSPLSYPCKALSRSGSPELLGQRQMIRDEDLSQRKIAIDILLPGKAIEH